MNESINDAPMENPESDEEIRARLLSIAIAEHGELLVDAIWYPELRQLTAVLVGNHRVVYSAKSHPKGTRFARTREDVIGWNVRAGVAAIFLVAGLAGSLVSVIALVMAFTDPPASSPWWLYLFGVFGGFCAYWVGQRKAVDLLVEKRFGK